jgi:hypothetical protein
MLGWIVPPTENGGTMVPVRGGTHHQVFRPGRENLSRWAGRTARPGSFDGSVTTFIRWSWPGNIAVEAVQHAEMCFARLPRHLDDLLHAHSAGFRDGLVLGLAMSIGPTVGEASGPHQLIHTGGSLDPVTAEFRGGHLHDAIRCVLARMRHSVWSAPRRTRTRCMAAGDSPPRAGGIGSAPFRASGINRGHVENRDQSSVDVEDRRTGTAQVFVIRAPQRSCSAHLHRPWRTNQTTARARATAIFTAAHALVGFTRARDQRRRG